MATIGYAGLPVPGGGDSPTTPGHLADLAAAIDPRLWQHVTNEADRNTRLAGAPARTVAVTPNGTTWIKTSNTTNTWITLWEPLPAWQPVTLASGYVAGETTPQLRIWQGRVWTRGRIARADGTLLPVAGGRLGSVPTAAIPKQLAMWAGGGSLTGDPMTGVGRVEVFSPDQDGNINGNRGSLVWHSQDGMQDGGTAGVFWADISGFYWLD
ncbi:hypothetical protein ACFYQA_02470 [Streptomyces sp. NPDC005774]|uniref:hypothetical protein n=1 Tax=Streptomyces sp. NPDC005774 TaxID=3364728 RepID=UPI0036BA42CF